MVINKPKLYPHDKLLKYTIIPLIPKRVRPNHITVIRFLLTPFVIWFLLKENYQIGTPLFIATAFTDAVDGSLARIRNQITKWGQTYDPLADKILIGSVMIILTLRYFLLIAVLIVIIEISFIFAGWAWKSKGLEIKSNNWGKAKMLLQAIGVTTLLFAISTNIPALFGLALIAFCLSIMLALTSFFTYGI